MGKYITSLRVNGMDFLFVFLAFTLPFTPEASQGKNPVKAWESESVGISEPHSGSRSDNLKAEPTLKIGSFNLKQFGKKKSGNDTILKIIARIVCRYDLIALQEITDVKENSMKKLMGALSRLSAYPYHFQVSDRVGRTKQKEQYGLVFRSDIFQVKRHILYDDSLVGDVFSREPQIAEVIIKQTGGKFALINVHVAPKNASTEISHLADVHSWVQDKWRIGNIVVLGDLNADCDYIRKKDIPTIRLMNASKYNWLIDNNVDTTVGNTNCAYDRIIVSGPLFKRIVVANSARAFQFDREYKLDQKDALSVSDHYPVEFSISIPVSNNIIQSDEPPHHIEISPSGGAVIRNHVGMHTLVVTVISVLSARLLK